APPFAPNRLRNYPTNSQFLALVHTRLVATPSSSPTAIVEVNLPNEHRHDLNAKVGAHHCWLPRLSPHDHLNHWGAAAFRDALNRLGWHINHDAKWRYFAPPTNCRPATSSPRVPPHQNALPANQPDGATSRAPAGRWDTARRNALTLARLKARCILTE